MHTLPVINFAQADPVASSFMVIIMQLCDACAWVELSSRSCRSLCSGATICPAVAHNCGDSPAAGPTKVLQSLQTLCVEQAETFIDRRLGLVEEAQAILTCPYTSLPTPVIASNASFRGLWI